MSSKTYLIRVVKSRDCVVKELKKVLFSIVVDFVLDQKGVPLLEAYDKWRNWADSKVCCDYSLHVGVTYWNENVAKEMEELVADKGMNISIFSLAKC